MLKSKIIKDFKTTTIDVEQGIVDDDDECIEDSYNSFIMDLEEETFANTQKYLTANGF